MIKKISENVYRIRVKKTSYNVEIIKQFDANYVYTIDRKDMLSFWRALSIPYGVRYIAEDFVKERVQCDWRWSPLFKTKDVAEKFLYYLDRKYNPTPQLVNEFIDIELWGNL